MKDWNPKVSGLMVLGRNGCLADFAMQGQCPSNAYSLSFIWL